jgi:hypothetical protein
MLKKKAEAAGWVSPAAEFMRFFMHFQCKSTIYLDKDMTIARSAKTCVLVLLAGSGAIR